MLNVNKDKKEGFIIHENNNKYILCKIIKEYSNKNEALKGLLKELKNKGSV